MDSSMDWLKENTIIHCVNNQKLVCHPLSSKWWGIRVVGLDSPGQTVAQRCPGTVNRQKGHMVPFLSCSRISQQVKKSYFKSNYAYFLDCKTDQSSSYYGLQWSVIFVETIFELFQNDIPEKTNADHWFQKLIQHSLPIFYSQKSSAPSFLSLALPLFCMPSSCSCYLPSRSWCILSRVSQWANTCLPYSCCEGPLCIYKALLLGVSPFDYLHYHLALSLFKPTVGFSGTTDGTLGKALGFLFNHFSNRGLRNARQSTHTHSE